MTKKRKAPARVAGASNDAPAPVETSEPKPPAPALPPLPPAPPPAPPSSPPAPQAGSWPTYRLGEGFITGGRSIRPGPPPVLRERDHDPLGIRRGLFDEGEGRNADEFDILYPSIKTVVPY
jgi:hypothetical protein